MEARLRRVLHCAVADISHYSGALPLRRFVRHKVAPREGGCVLGLHRVLPRESGRKTNCLDGMAITDESFVLLLEYLRKRFRIVPLGNALDDEGAVNGSKPFCALTFDDGWRDTYQIAFPWLKRCGMPATIFLTTGVVGETGGFWVERFKKAWVQEDLRDRAEVFLGGLYPRPVRTADFMEIIEWLMRMPSGERQALLDHLLPAAVEHGEDVDSMMTWDQAIEMSRAGIEFGAHTVTHPLLTYEDDATIGHELLESKRTLEEKLNQPVSAFAYPGGDWDDRVRGLVARAGYTCAFTTQPAWCRHGQDRYAIGRVLIHEGNVTDAKGRFSPSMVDWTLSGWG